VLVLGILLDSAHELHDLDLVLGIIVIFHCSLDLLLFVLYEVAMERMALLIIDRIQSRSQFIRCS
jgi:hypothetical protein